MSEDPQRRETEESLRKKRFIRMLAYMAVIYASLGVSILSLLPGSTDWLKLLREFAIPSIGLIVSMVALGFLQSEMKSRRKYELFTDVDARNRAEHEALVSAGIANVEVVSPKKDGRDDGRHNNFLDYFHGLRRVLEQKSTSAEEKASILLDKGIAYSRAGIVFFVISIIGWQIVMANYGFHNEHIYGIVSCSLLFIFIEFLSAWFLKQYRHFIDTSTYLIKVKSIFDRFMLAYLAAEEFGGFSSDEHSKRNAAAILEMLRDPIRWPDEGPLTAADIGFAKDAVDSLVEVARAARGGAVR